MNEEIQICYLQAKINYAYLLPFPLYRPFSALTWVPLRALPEYQHKTAHLVIPQEWQAQSTSLLSMLTHKKTTEPLMPSSYGRIAKKRPELRLEPHQTWLAKCAGDKLTYIPIGMVSKAVTTMKASAPVRIG